MSHRILVVDDNPGVREVICDICRMAGFPADTADSAADTMRLCGIHKYDLIFLDMVIGDDDGRKVAEMIRHLPPPNCEPVIVALTGFGAETTPLELLECGINQQLGKPQMPGTLIDIIQRVLNPNDPVA